MTILQLAAWLEETALSLWVRESLWGFAILVAVHVMGLTMSVGTLLWFDLRLLGVSMSGCAVSKVYRRLMPWFAGGFTVMLVSGGMLLTGFATSAVANTAFRVKMAAILLAAVNALVYHFATERHIAQWDEAARPPFHVRLAGVVSIGAWVTVILAGRMMSYTMF
jgi:hypothetical protein